MPSLHCFSLSRGANVPCPASGRVVPGTRHLSGVHRRGRMWEGSRGFPERTGGTRSWPRLLQRRIRTGKEYLTRLLLQTMHLKEGNQLALFRAHLSAEHRICTAGIINRSFGWWKSYKSLIVFKQPRFLLKNKFNYLNSSSQC